MLLRRCRQEGWLLRQQQWSQAVLLRWCRQGELEQQRQQCQAAPVFVLAAQQRLLQAVLLRRCR